MHSTQRGAAVKGKDGRNRMESGLSAREKAMVEELHEIFRLIHMDYWNIEKYPQGVRGGLLELDKRQTVVGEIIVEYTLVDEALTDEICRYFFGVEKNSIEL